jgi:tetratricopeptide (TPR) repeat protein
VLRIAATIGERFEFGLLQEITHQDESELLGLLKEMITAGLVVEESADRFAFRHALTRATVYEMPMQRERRSTHRLIGETIERSYGNRAGAAAPQLAYHFYQAGVWDKAVQYSVQAGERAQALYARRETLFHFTHALDAARYLDVAPPRSCLRGRAQAYDAGGDFDHALADYEASLDWSRREVDRAGEWQALVDLGLLWQSRDLERAGAYYQEALELAQGLQDPSLLAQSLNRIGNWNLNRGRVDEALPAHQQALDVFRRSDDRRGTAQTLELLGMGSYQVGQVSQGTRYLEQALPILRELDDRQALINTLTNLAFRGLLETEVLGETDCRQLVELGEEALQLARSANWRQGELRVLISLAGAFVQAGNYARAIELLSWAKSLAEESRGRESLVRLQMTHGSVFMDLLAWSQARQHFEAAVATAQELGSGLLGLAATARLVSALIAQNELEPAQELLNLSLPRDFPDDRAPSLQRRLWYLRAELEREGGNSRRSLEIVDWLLATTVGLAEHGPHAVPLLSRLRGRALAALGRLDDAEAEFRNTLVVASRQGRRPMVWRLHMDLGRVYRSMARHEEAEYEFATARAGIAELATSVPEGPLRDEFWQQASAMLPAAHVPTARQAAKTEFGGLTAREREVAALIAQAKSNREIASELVISEKTTERHIANILSKLRFNSRTQIAVWAVDKGLRK